MCAALLLQALRVSVGQLGIIGRVKFHIVPEVPVRRWVVFRGSREWREKLQPN
jgi:hypothetical protein